MELGIDKKQADDLIDRHITDPITKLHCLESAEIMKALARKFRENEEKWGIIGLLHDIDWDLTKNNCQEHCQKAVTILKEVGASDFLINSVLSHGYGNKACGAPEGKERSTKLEHSLAAAETLTGLIVASALVQPDKKLANVKLKSLKNKFKNKKFAANCSREIILECEKTGVNLDDFLEIGLTALQDIAPDIGL